MKVGILNLQGAFREHIEEHIEALRKCDCEAMEIRKPEDMDEVQGLIVSGIKRTTEGILRVDFKILDKVLERAEKGMPIFGTCDGISLLAKEVEESSQPTMGLMDITVKRKDYGYGKESFKADLFIPALGAKPVRAVFIRAPYITRVKPNVGILCIYDDKIVMARQGNFLACSFYPELTYETRVHQYFIQMVKDAHSI
ncbi:MAG: pyridoxal 5'-phosphate synthase glutaminase subunit PdxT [Bacillota bacterium]|uniref:Pyridoxal 5'-phosphate synthase glutaminase subunit PdxT n=1 Tax=Thermanaerosceptrum fracticalcis TaxID=1712410 RepID=A0A7G6E579_THEFR|nr:pyridoxal 5'-phosphate synthase glutaminase subunit PdxT [Thermanaerosceptrum fracticalcis]QNB47233.1 pyridoxal 5'-phosphate synthase glutaminase subunit PdxT [Thermanaerosceptrum fracticalcis]